MKFLSGYVRELQKKKKKYTITHISIHFIFISGQRNIHSSKIKKKIKIF